MDDDVSDDDLIDTYENMEGLDGSGNELTVGFTSPTGADLGNELWKRGILLRKEVIDYYNNGFYKSRKVYARDPTGKSMFLKYSNEVEYSPIGRRIKDTTFRNAAGYTDGKTVVTLYNLCGEPVEKQTA